MACILMTSSRRCGYTNGLKLSPEDVAVFDCDHAPLSAACQLVSYKRVDPCPITAKAVALLTLLCP
jgi:hypothetical protein